MVRNCIVRQGPRECFWIKQISCNLSLKKLIYCYLCISQLFLRFCCAYIALCACVIDILALWISLRLGYHRVSDNHTFVMSLRRLKYLSEHLKPPFRSRLDFRHCGNFILNLADFILRGRLEMSCFQYLSTAHLLNFRWTVLQPLIQFLSTGTLSYFLVNKLRCILVWWCLVRL